jgi:hypothetical protein
VNGAVDQACGDGGPHGFVAPWRLRGSDGSNIPRSAEERLPYLPSLVLVLWCVLRLSIKGRLR